MAGGVSSPVDSSIVMALKSFDEYVTLAEAAHGGAHQEFAAALGAVEKRGVQVGAQDAGD